MLTNDINQNNILLYVIIALMVVLVIVILFIIIRQIKKKNFFIERKKANNELIECLGGIDNIVKAVATGSRLSLVLNNYQVVSEDKLKSLGVSSIIKMSNKITLVIGEEAKDIALLINKN